MFLPFENWKFQYSNGLLYVDVSQIIHETVMSIFSDKLALVQFVINCLYSVAQMCIGEDTLAYVSGALSIDDVMSYNSLTTGPNVQFWDYHFSRGLILRNLTPNNNYTENSSKWVSAKIFEREGVASTVMIYVMDLSSI